MKQNWRNKLEEKTRVIVAIDKPTIVLNTHKQSAKYTIKEI